MSPASPQPTVDHGRAMDDTDVYLVDLLNCYCFNFAVDVLGALIIFLPQRLGDAAKERYFSMIVPGSDN